MKKLGYSEPDMELIVMAAEDVIMASNQGDNGVDALGLGLLEE